MFRGLSQRFTTADVDFASVIADFEGKVNPDR